MADVIINVSGTKGDKGDTGLPGGSPPAGRILTNGEAGSTPVPVAGYVNPADYQVLLSWTDSDPGGNSGLWAVKTATYFTVYHHGINFTYASYLVTPTV